MSEAQEQTLSEAQVSILGKLAAQKLMMTNLLHGLAVGVARDQGITPHLNTKDQWEVVKAAIRELADQIDDSGKAAELAVQQAEQAEALLRTLVLDDPYAGLRKNNADEWRCFFCGCGPSYEVEELRHQPDCPIETARRMLSS